MEETKNYLFKQADIFPEIRERFLSMSILLDKRLYGVYSKDILELLKIPLFLCDDMLAQFYFNAVKPIEENLDSICLSKFAIEAAKSLHNKEDGKKLLENLLQIVKKNKEALFLCKVALLKVNYEEMTQTECEESIFELKKAMERGSKKFGRTSKANFYSVELMINDKFYNAEAYLKAALNFLKNSDLSKIRPEDKLVLAKGVFFASLLCSDLSLSLESDHPLFSILKNKNMEVFIITLEMLNSGRVREFTEAVLRNGKIKNEFGFLVGKEKRFLRKIREIAFLRLCSFVLSKKHREILLNDAGKICFMNEDELRDMLIDLISGGFVEGKIDQIAGLFRVKRVKPHRLDMEEIKNFCNGARNWAQNINDSISLDC